MDFVRFIQRIYHDALSSECQICPLFYIFLPDWDRNLVKETSTKNFNLLNDFRVPRKSSKRQPPFNCGHFPHLFPDSGRNSMLKDSPILLLSVRACYANWRRERFIFWTGINYITLACAPCMRTITTHETLEVQAHLGKPCVLQHRVHYRQFSFLLRNLFSPTVGPNMETQCSLRDFFFKYVCCDYERLLR